MEENYQVPRPDDQAPTEQEFVAPGVPIVRTSTPRPMPFPDPAKTELPLAPSASAADFPVQAPDAPPLPEEPVHGDGTLREQKAPTPPRSATYAADGGQEINLPADEFIWLFEYALDMDPLHLNRPERLGGAAFAYGPAVLKGYQLLFEGLEPASGQVTASLRKAPEHPEAEVWGMLYRVPRRFTIGEAGDVALLDKVHYAGAFAPVEVQAREPYRQREINCLTYIATEATRRQVNQLAPEKRVPESAYSKRLLQVARRQKLPLSYVRLLEELVSSEKAAATPLAAISAEQNTEPLSAVATAKPLRRRSSEFPASLTPAKRGEYSTLAWKADSRPAEVSKPYRPLWKADSRPGERGEEAVSSWQTDALAYSSQGKRTPAWSTEYAPHIERWLKVFALYVGLILLGTLILAVFQGLSFWPDVFNNAFTPLGIPWYILLYGLLGGCVSCIISLNRAFLNNPPTFTIFTWFARPLLGAVLGAFAYLLLNSGAVLLSAQSAQHFALCSIASGLAGLCEGKLLLNKHLANLS